MFDLFLAPAIAGGAAPAIVSPETEELPRAVHRMISAAMNTHDPAQLEAVTAAAKQ